MCATLLTQAEKERIAVEDEKLIYFIAHRYSTSILDPDELNSVARTGFTKALNNFDTSKGVKFSTYAINCMKNEILFALRKEKAHFTNNISMNTVLAKDKHGNDLALEETVSNVTRHQANAEEIVLQQLDFELLNEAVDELEERDRFIVIHRYGLKGEKPKTQNDVAKMNDMSQANVSKLEKGALEKLKHILMKKRFEWH